VAKQLETIATDASDAAGLSALPAVDWAGLEDDLLQHELARELPGKPRAPAFEAKQLPPATPLQSAAPKRHTGHHHNNRQGQLQQLAAHRQQRRQQQQQRRQQQKQQQHDDSADQGVLEAELPRDDVSGAFHLL